MPAAAGGLAASKPAFLELSLSSLSGNIFYEDEDVWQPIFAFNINFLRDSHSEDTKEMRSSELIACTVRNQYLSYRRRIAIAVESRRK